MACKRVIKTNMGIQSLSASRLWRPRSHTHRFFHHLSVWCHQQLPDIQQIWHQTEDFHSHPANTSLWGLIGRVYMVYGGLWPHNVFSWPKNRYAVCNLSPWVNGRNVGLLRTLSGFSQCGEWNVPFLGRKMPLFALFETIKFFLTMALTTVTFPQGGTGQRDNSWTHASKEH